MSVLDCIPAAASGLGRTGTGRRDASSFTGTCARTLFRADAEHAFANVLVFSCIALASFRLLAAQEPGQAAPDAIDSIVSTAVEPENQETIDEIVVYGDQPMIDLRQQVYQSEQNFFEIFSALNEDDDYDVRCFYEVPSFTHIRQHVCRAKFVVDAKSAEAAPAFSNEVGALKRPAVYEIRRKTEKLQALMEQLVAENPELAQALAEYTDAKQILDSAQKRRFGSNP